MRFVATALLASILPANATDGIVNAFGSWRIERVDENDSYRLVGLPTQGTKIGFSVQCFPGQNALSLMLPFPSDFTSNEKEVTVLAWSDRPETVTTKWLVFDRIAAISMIAPGIMPGTGNPHGEAGERFLSVLREAPTAFSYSIGPFSMTHDTFHLHAALQRFSELCGPTPVPLSP
jgi:hypothetical protein